ncbi:hypothetical protein AB0N16_22690 [Streptomyces sp. NPDC051105]|uniref:hypothetical protein n=1 Tax=Streptomyces sp. NPDC051105 TaxID=3154843 RepID=UPI00344951F1
MTNQPHEGYDPYQQYQQPQQPQQSQQPAQPQWGYEEQQYATQQWQGQTWETQTHAPVQAAQPQASAAETAYMPQQTYAPAQAQAQQHAQQPQSHPQQPQQAYAQPQQAHAQQQPAYPQQSAYPQQPQPQQPQRASQPPQSAHTPPPVPTPAAGAGPAESGSPGSGYGPATVAGNARITDAQRARLEGRSPIIEPGMQPALLTGLLGLLLAVAAPISSYALVVPLVILQAVTAAGWFRLNGMWPARQGIALAFLGALAADAAVLVAGRDQAPAAILGPLGIWVLLSLVLQLRSHADADTRMYGLMATVASSALAIIATGFLGADPDAASVGAAAVAVAVVARALPLPTVASVIVSVLAAAGAGIAVGGMTGVGAKGALIGAGAAVCALAGHRAASYDYPSKFVHFTAGVALPLAAAAPAVWILGR